jgi:hypothetical protein
LSIDGILPRKVAGWSRGTLHIPGVAIPILLLLLLCPGFLGAQAPAALLGSWADDYGSRHLVTDTLWSHDGANKYVVLRWDSAGQYAIARNAATNKADAGKFTRIDWMSLEGITGMRPYIWAFCLTTWDAPTADSAARVTPAQRATPRTGCGGFPFTRLKPEPTPGTGP